MGFLTAPIQWALFSAILLSSGVCSQAGKKENPVAWGRCPNIPGSKDFSAEKFSGEWAMSHQFRQPRFLPCQKFDFGVTSPAAMYINGSVKAGGSLTLGIQGKSVVADPSHPGLMDWSWNYLPLMTERVTMMDTDYTTYAVLALCQDFGLFHANFGFMLSRDPLFYNKEEYGTYLERARNILSPYLIVGHGPTRTCRFYEDTEDDFGRNIDISGTISEIEGLASKISARI